MTGAGICRDIVFRRLPVARLVALQEPKRKIRYGLLAGKFKIPKDFDAPLPDDVLASFYR